MIKNYFTNYKTILLGAFLLMLYFWSRFLRERTPKDLPLTLSVLGFFILVYICCIFLYLVLSLVILPRQNIYLEIVLDWVFTPIKDLERFVRSLPVIRTYYKQVLIFVMPLLEFLVIKTYIFFFVCWLFPRLVLLTALFIDVFYFSHFHYKYQVILFGLLLFFNRCFKYSLKNIKEDFINNLVFYVKDITTTYVPGIHPSEREPDYNPEEDDEWFPTMVLPLKVFIKFQTESIVYQNITRDKQNHITLEAKQMFWEQTLGEKYVVYFNQPIPPDYKNKFGDKAPDNYWKAYEFVKDKVNNYIEEEYEKTMKISLLIEYYNKTSNANPQVKKLKLLIYLNYLLCWLYVLIISLPSLNITELLLALMKTWFMITDPFSDIDVALDLLQYILEDHNK